MSLRRALGVFVAVALIACRSTAPGASKASPSAASGSATAAVSGKALDPEEQARFLGQKLEDMPLELGPPAAGAPLAEHEQRVKELLSGQTPAERLPEVSTDANTNYDSGLFQRLTTVVVERGSGRVVSVAIGQIQLVSGKLDETSMNRVTRGMRAGFRSCYRRAFDVEGDDVPEHKELTLLLSIAASGDVKEATLQGDLEPSLAVFAMCVKNRARAAFFDPSSDGGSSVRIQLTLQSAPEGSLGALELQK